MKRNLRNVILAAILSSGIVLASIGVAFAVQVQFVNDLGAFPSKDIYWYVDHNYVCTSPSGGRTCSSEMSPGSYRFDVRDEKDNILCFWEPAEVIEGQSVTLSYPNEYCK